VCFTWTPARGASVEYASGSQRFMKTREDVLRIVAREEKIIGRLRAAGFPVSSFSTPQKPRTSSVLFVPPSLSADEVARLKTATGLTVSVEPLRWKVKGDALLVVGSDDFLK
jgi:hypothetical protein